MVDTEGRDDESPYDWDEANEGHVARHGVEWWEAEEALEDPDRANLARGLFRDEYRYLIAGRTLSGRVLAVVYVVRDRLIRVATARPASAHEIRIYRRSK
jgi:uncharacterized DUF497 family protein